MHCAPGWLASDLGIGARTGLHAELTAYSIVFWGHDALPAQDMVAWQQEKARLMAEMSLAGQKGAYGKLGALSSGLNRAFDNHIELSLRAGAGTHVRTEEALALANGLAEETSCRVLAWSVCRNHVHVIAELTEEKGVDELVCSWKALAPSMNWEDAYHTEALKAREAAARVDALISELGDDAVAAVDAEADGAVSGTGFRHITVLLHETVDMLKAGPGKFIVDCTLGGGGHTELLLEQGATVWGIDRDADARRAAMLRLARFGSRFKALAGNFQDVESILSQQGVSRVDGLLADLGVSSHQLDTAARGFSFREDGPLDMRMDTRAAFSARNLVNEAPEEEIANIIWQFGEERASRAIARAIGKARAQAPITTTAQLARIVESVLPRKGRQHPGTRTFQALRIAVNGELDALDALLDSSVRLLGQGGRMAVITFHSLEDRRVKQFFELRSRPEIDRPEWPAPRPNPDYCFRRFPASPLLREKKNFQPTPVPAAPSCAAWKKSSDHLSFATAMKRFKQRFTGHQISVSMIMWLIAFASLTCGAGITYAVLKNDQIQVARDIKQMNEEIASCELTKEYYRSKTSSLTSRWAIRDRLAQDKSNLQPIEPSAVEYISSENASRIAAAGH